MSVCCRDFHVRAWDGGRRIERPGDRPASQSLAACIGIETDVPHAPLLIPPLVTTPEVDSVPSSAHQGDKTAFLFRCWRDDETPSSTPVIGLDLFVRMPSASSDDTMTVVETIDAPGSIRRPIGQCRNAFIFTCKACGS